MKSILLHRIFIVLILAVSSIVLFGFWNYFRMENEAKITAGNYSLALKSMRELVFLRDGIERGEIKRGCFVRSRIEEAISDIDFCLRKEYALCSNYAKTMAPRDFLENYHQ